MSRSPKGGAASLATRHERRNVMPRCCSRPALVEHNACALRSSATGAESSSLARADDGSLHRTRFRVRASASPLHRTLAYSADASRGAISVNIRLFAVPDELSVDRA